MTRCSSPFVAWHQLETGVLEPLARELVPIAIVLGFVPIIVTMSLYLGLLVDTLLAFGYHQAHRIPPVRDMVQAFLSALVFAVICVVSPFLWVIRAMMAVFQLLPLHGVRVYIADHAMGMAHGVPLRPPVSILSAACLYALFWIFGEENRGCPMSLALCFVAWFQTQLALMIWIKVAYRWYREQPRCETRKEDTDGVD